MTPRGQGKKEEKTITRPTNTKPKKAGTMKSTAQASHHKETAQKPVPINSRIANRC
jgi:hypothetical protein